MQDNRDIYNFYGLYIEKFVYFNQHDDFSIVDKYSYDETEEIGLIKRGDIYRYEKEISKDEYYNFYENGEHKNQFENCYVKFKQTNKDYNYNGRNVQLLCLFYSNNTVEFSIDDGIYVSMSIKEVFNVRLDILDISNGECVPGFTCYIKDSDNNIITMFVTTKEKEHFLTLK